MNPKGLPKKNITNANGLSPLNTTGFIKIRRKVPVLEALQMTGPFHIDDFDGRLTGKEGDYLIVGSKFRGIVAKEDFEKEWAVIKA